MKTNTKSAVLDDPSLVTHEGAKAVKIDSVQHLRRSVLATMLFENEFYEDGESIAKRIHDEVSDVLNLKNGPQIVADLAYEARTEMKLRHAPLWLLTALVHAKTTDANKVLASAIERTIQRADELAEFVAMLWKDGKHPLPNQVKKGLSAAFRKFDRYQLSKYANREGAIKLRDVLFMVHAKPEVSGRGKKAAAIHRESYHRGEVLRHSKDQALLWRELAENELKAPEETWEVALSAGGDKKQVFTDLLENNQLGPLAILRNLRNMQQSGVDAEAIRQGLKKMKVERVLPFRFITAARYAPILEPELESAMFKCLSGHAKLPGKTVLVVDNSGSMASPISGKSELRRVDAACALAMLLREICDECQVVVFGSTAGLIPPRRGFALRDSIVGSEHSGGTNTETALQVATREGYDRCIVITDEQSHQTISNPVKDTKGYFINVASYVNGIGYKKWIHMDGFSEAVVSYIQQYENSNK
jgi:60 kDa SS-A/Ro ribonucleoprotein